MAAAPASPASTADAMTEARILQMAESALYSSEKHRLGLALGIGASEDPDDDDDVDALLARSAAARCPDLRAPAADSSFSSATTASIVGDSLDGGNSSPLGVAPRVADMVLNSSERWRKRTEAAVLSGGRDQDHGSVDGDTLSTLDEAPSSGDTTLSAGSASSSAKATTAAASTTSSSAVLSSSPPPGPTVVVARRLRFDFAKRVVTRSAPPPPLKLPLEEQQKRQQQVAAEHCKAPSSSSDASEEAAAAATTLPVAPSPSSPPSALLSSHLNAAEDRASGWPAGAMASGRAYSFLGDATGFASQLWHVLVLGVGYYLVGAFSFLLYLVAGRFVCLEGFLQPRALLKVTSTNSATNAMKNGRGHEQGEQGEQGASG